MLKKEILRNFTHELLFELKEETKLLTCVVQDELCIKKENKQTQINCMIGKKMLCDLNCEFIFAKRRNNDFNVIWVVENFEMTNHTSRHHEFFFQINYIFEKNKLLDLNYAFYSFLYNKVYILHHDSPIFFVNWKLFTYWKKNYDPTQHTSSKISYSTHLCVKHIIIPFCYMFVIFVKEKLITSNKQMN